MIKLIVLGLIIYIIYIVFFKKSIPFSQENQVYKRRKEREKDAQTVVECKQCGTYVSLDEAILVDGKYFCSKECVDAYNRS